MRSAGRGGRGSAKQGVREPFSDRDIFISIVLSKRDACTLKTERIVQYA